MSALPKRHLDTGACEQAGTMIALVAASWRVGAMPGTPPCLRRRTLLMGTDQPLQRNPQDLWSSARDALRCRSVVGPMINLRCSVTGSANHTLVFSMAPGVFAC